MIIDLKPYFRGEKFHPFYKQSCVNTKDMLIHFDALPPDKLLAERRPAESETIWKYRKMIYECPTQQDCEKVMNSLMKIRKSQDWMIKYPADNPYSIPDKETLYQYMEVDFPKFGSFTNWYFQLGFKTYLTDANAIVLWMPLNKTTIDDDGAVIPIADNVYLKPYPIQFKSEQIIDYIEGEWYLLLSKDKATYKISGKEFNDGKIYLFVDTVRIITLKQIDNNGTFSSEEYIHGLDDLPIVNFGGVIQDESNGHSLSKSRLSPMLPMFREAIREYSDLQAEVVQHMHSTLWAEQGQECKKCRGAGLIPVKNKPHIECSECHGHGFYPFNPYENFVKRKPQAGETASAGVPAGFILKDTAITKLQDERIRQHRLDGLGAINMEFIANTPLNQSGKAKEVDKAELNNFVHVIAEDVVKFFDECYEIVCDYRYSGIVPAEDAREEMLPTIPVPEKFDILSETYLAQEIELLQRYKASPSIINAALIEYTNKKFSAEEEIKDFVTATIKLDPFSSETEDDILIKLQNNGITEQDYVIHCNIKSFVSRAEEENELFYGLDMQEQEKIMNKYADEVIKENSAKAAVLNIVPKVIPSKVA